MNSLLKQAFDLEMRTALEDFAAGALDDTFRHLQRAHILEGQILAAAMDPVTEPVRVYPVKTENGKVYVDIGE